MKILKLVTFFLLNSNVGFFYCIFWQCWWEVWKEIATCRMRSSSGWSLGFAVFKPLLPSLALACLEDAIIMMIIIIIFHYILLCQLSCLCSFQGFNLHRLPYAHSGYEVSFNISCLIFAAASLPMMNILSNPLHVKLCWAPKCTFYWVNHCFNT